MIPYSRAWHISKIILQSFIIIFCIVVISLSISLALNFPVAVLIALWTVPQVVVSLCWSIAELITICARKSHRGIHPGAHVALHLLLWLGFCISLGLTVWIFASVLVYYSSFLDYDDYYGYSSYGDDYDITPGYFTLIEALVAFVALLM